MEPGMAVPATEDAGHERVQRTQVQHVRRVAGL